MMPNINPKQLEKMARQMGMQVQNIEATEVIIKSPDGDLIIKNPSVTKVCMGSTETFQVMGEAVREEKVKAEDVEILMQKTGVEKAEAEKLLAETGDLVTAIKRAKK